jgi:hypothetical protein
MKLAAEALQRLEALGQRVEIGPFTASSEIGAEFVCF